MSTITADTLRMRSAAMSLDNVASMCRNAAGNVETVKSSLRFFQGAGSPEVKRSIEVARCQMLEEAAKADTLADALREVAQFYLHTELKIRDSLGGEADIGTEKRGFFKRFWDWVTGKEPDTAYTATTSEQEQAADREFQAQIAALTDSSRFSEETWQRSSVEERKNILNDYMNEVAAILGVDVVSNINYTNTPPSDDGTYNLGAYQHGSRTVNINEYILTHDAQFGSYQLMSTVVHELRHAYQHSAVDHPEQYQVSKETIDSWKESFRTYNQEQAKGFDAYRNIVVERDARWFAGQE